MLNFFLNLGFVLEAILTVLTDCGFRIPTPEAKICTDIAETLCKWITVNKTTFTDFSSQLLSKIKGVIKKHPTTSSLREKMWASFATLLSSNEYDNLWNSLMQQAKVSTTSLLFQGFVSKQVLSYHLKNEYPFQSLQIDSVTSENLTKDEENALQYVGGYIIRRLKSKFEKINNNQEVAALHSFLEDTETETDTETSPEKTWTEIIDRGGLYHCKVEFYNFLVSIELITKHAIKEEGSFLKDGFAKRAETKIKMDEEVLHWWDCACAINDISNELAPNYWMKLYNCMLSFVDFVIQQSGWKSTSKILTH